MPQALARLFPRHQLADNVNMVSSTSIERKSESCMERTEETKPESTSSFSLEHSKVRFSQKLEEYHTILGRDSFSEREMRHCWYTEEEKERYMDRHERSAERLEKGERSKRGESFRGLEGWTQDGGDEINEMIADCIDAVLHEQGRQWKKERLNPNNLALISESKSKKCIKIALKTGKRDMKEAIRSYESMGIDDLDLDSDTSHSIASLVTSTKSATSSSNDSDENDLYRPRTSQMGEGRRRSTSGRRSSAYRRRGGDKSTKGRSGSSTSHGMERKRHSKE